MCEFVRRRDISFANLLAGGEKLVARPFGKRLGSDCRECVIRSPELLARIYTPTLAAKPLAVQQVSSGDLRAGRRARESLYGRDVPMLGGVAFGHERPTSRLD